MLSLFFSTHSEKYETFFLFHFADAFIQSIVQFGKQEHPVPEAVGDLGPFLNGSAVTSFWCPQDLIEQHTTLKHNSCICYLLERVWAEYYPFDSL